LEIKIDIQNQESWKLILKKILIALGGLSPPSEKKKQKKKIKIFFKISVQDS